ncbi:hypothetical protein [Clostridium estertheticum]|uniref:Uncharacterized protein n=1 Tax=Clostridium estertheticum TaxID=238834 RepID=A0A5N7J0Q6_9CLOT|nr:hypothetical protein [Clostridium estertheticum]MPQ62326.1 hypothetical protein [Clostridium estertheticum]
MALLAPFLIHGAAFSKTFDVGSLLCRIRSYISTCNKNGRDIMDSLKNAIKGDPFIPESI